jgi:diphthamide synthase (EF-2-diphthine--ammonia ligase)
MKQQLNIRQQEFMDLVKAGTVFERRGQSLIAHHVRKTFPVAMAKAMGMTFKTYQQNENDDDSWSDDWSVIDPMDLIEDEE